MKRLLLFVVIGAALVLTTGARGAAASAHADPSGAQYYLSLGDSLAQGYEPIGGTRSRNVIPTGYHQGYADQLFKLERDTYTQLQLVKLGCGGESTVSLLYGSQDAGVASSCGPPSFYEQQYPNGGTQLAEAVSFLEAHRGSVAFITIDLGGNDLIGPSGVGPLLTNLPIILSQLQAAAGPGVPIVGMNYYDPFAPQAWMQGGLPGLQAQVADLVDFNDLLEGMYAAAGDPVADVEAAFAVTDTTPVDGTPLDVVRECAWTWICTPAPLGPDIHANATGYGVIARAFAQALA
ncbi:MAG TPA: SGNH/GDSL hydrolase family protein [Gaiellaceae bacterium]|jgi:lysophospholipase L1-like esterase|nr:SGNH/GDSL hydrolase family protein [Gaiellaceae bacterium]